MSKEQKDFLKLLEKYKLNLTSQEEEDQLFAMIRSGKYDQKMEEHVLASLLDKANEGVNLPDKKASEILFKLQTQISASKQQPVMKKITGYRRWVAAAAFLILSASGLYLIFNPFSKTIPTQAERFKNDIVPGTNKATLTLAGGKTLFLDSLQAGSIAKQENTAIIKMDEGELVYNDSASLGFEMNTLTIPRGGQYQLTLSDGTKVWLNAASSITFPSAFIGKERRVDIKGECYFEVAKNLQKPFIVNIAGKAEIKVLGTHFNINAYEDEAVIKTTLLEGSVSVSSLSNVSEENAAYLDSRILAPGEQASQNQGGELTVAKVDTESIVAWKDGLISCKDASIQDIMREIERWYDVEVEYEGKVPERIFTGEISRNMNLSEVLRILEFSNILFRIEGRKIIVM